MRKLSMLSLIAVVSLMAGCGGGDDQPESSSRSSSPTTTPDAKAATCEDIPVSQIAQITGYPLKHVREGSQYGEEQRAIEELEGFLCTYTTEPLLAEVQSTSPYYVRIGGGPGGDDDLKCEDDPDRPDDRCQEVQGVGDRATLSAHSTVLQVQEGPRQGETIGEYRETSFLIRMGDKIFNVTVSATDNKAEDGAREEAAKKIASLVLDTFGR